MPRAVRVWLLKPEAIGLKLKQLVSSSRSVDSESFSSDSKPRAGKGSGVFQCGEILPTVSIQVEHEDPRLGR